MAEGPMVDLTNRGRVDDGSTGSKSRPRRFDRVDDD